MNSKDMPVPDSIKLTKGYNKMIERVRAHYASATTSNALDDAVEFAKSQAVEKDELSPEEAEKVASYVVRDLHAAADFLSDTDKSLADWFKFDIELIEERLWEMMVSVADQTKIELQALKQDAKLMSEYHTGEVSGPATLQCNDCKHLINMHETTKIPPCPKCKSTVFTRYSFGDEE